MDCFATEWDHFDWIINGLEWICLICADVDLLHFDQDSFMAFRCAELTIHWWYNSIFDCVCWFRSYCFEKQQQDNTNKMTQLHQLSSTWTRIKNIYSRSLEWNVVRLCKLFDQIRLWSDWANFIFQFSLTKNQTTLSSHWLMNSAVGNLNLNLNFIFVLCIHYISRFYRSSSTRRLICKMKEKKRPITSAKSAHTKFAGNFWPFKKRQLFKCQSITELCAII